MTRSHGLNHDASKAERRQGREEAPIVPEANPEQGDGRVIFPERTSEMGRAVCACVESRFTLNNEADGAAER